MTGGGHRRALVALALLAASAAPVAAQRVTAPLAWPAPTPEARPWTRWWWMGDAVTPAGIDAELEALAAAGFGGVEITATYGARGAEAASMPYLSPRWLALVDHAARTARRLGMRVDLPLGSGWRLGGPDVVPADASRSLRLVRDSLHGTYVADVTPSGERVKRPAPGGEGPSIDVYSRAAVEHYLSVFGARLAPLPPADVRAFFHDSFEYGGDASAELFDFFASRRGYDLRTELPALAGEGDPDRVARVKSDYRETLDEMLLEHFIEPLATWAHQHGRLLREQAHGSPANLLDLYAASDIPETESFGPLGGRDADPLVHRFASSAAHVAGRQLASAEAFTWMAEHFTATLDDARRVADELFFAGVNHLVYHGTAYSPADAPWPGWQFYASSEWNPRNAWWRDVPALNAYVTRVQSVLQRGRPEAEVLLYWPVYDSWHDPSGRRIDFRVHDPVWLRDMPVGAAARALLAAGDAFDYVSDRQLRTAVRVASHGVTAGGVEYQAVVVPSTTHMPPETLERLVALARSGATVILLDGGPADVPGLGALASRRARLAAARAVIPAPPSAGASATSAPVGQGRIIVGHDLSALLAQAGISPDPLATIRGVRVVRRGRADGHDWFIGAPAATGLHGWVSLGAGAASVVLMDPMTGRTGRADLRPGADGRARIRLDVEAGATIIVRTFDVAIAAPRWPYARVTGRTLPLSGRWSVRFIAGGPTLPAAFTSDTLSLWTSRGDADADRFAGTARYTLDFAAPADAADFLLDLGRVAESARVRINDRDAGTLVSAPFRVRTGALRHGMNRLEVDVTNVSANRVRDLDRRGVPWKIFHDINYVGIDYRPFDASGWPVRPSGLAGPVTLTPLAPLDARAP